MSTYHKITELSITIVSLASLMLNFLFPHIALANNIGGNNILSFNISETAKVLLFVSEENNAIDEVNAELSLEDTEDINDKNAENICNEAGIRDLPCWQDLKAMREKESFDGKKMTGDGGKSRGWYHIQIKMHEVSDECALDFKCSTEWTVKNLIANGYKTNRVYAISRHNGSGKAAETYARNVVYLSAKFEQ